ncbi:hypothetical protein SLA2020_012450 [Shorea laevis]
MVSKEHGMISTEREACSLQNVLKWEKNLMFDRIVVEIDCTSIDTAINNDHILNSSLSTILLDHKYLMTSFVVCQLQHVQRTGNLVAHELARRALQVDVDMFWLANIPNFLAPFVTRD